MTPQTSADEHLHAGQDALRRAVQAHGAAGSRVEDVPYDPALLRLAREHFEAASSLFDTEGRATEWARARLGAAEVGLKMASSAEAYAAAEASSRAALASLDTVTDRATSLDAYLLLAEAMAVPIEHLADGAEKEGRIDQALGVLRAAEYLASQQPDAFARARVGSLLSHVLGERFRGDRDAHLLDAIRAGQRALPALRERQQESPLSYPALLVHLGNCFMKLDGPRERWLAEGLAAYRDGLAATDPRIAPRLHHLLDANVRMAESLIAAHDEALPEKERVGRFGARVQAALDAGDFDTAEAVALEMLRWAWSLRQAPNLWVGEAHKLLGNLLLHRGDAAGAQNHFYCATVVLSAAAATGGPREAALLGGAEQLLASAMERLGQSALTAPLTAQARRAFAAARSSVETGMQLLARDPAAAHAHFDRAISLYPRDPLALFCRGAAAMAQSAVDAALRDFDAVLYLQPRNVAALYNRALLREQRGDNDGAVADLEHALGEVSDPQERASIEAHLRRLRGSER
ncbi:MAG TPA: tetratricopeptide repeat protein [Archangium sp.]|uniref:tetratricopeptide repeat protein n=1 Tax=Archangium sp. TaxID=1872627 RepID=UPI002E3378F4|nr:tetratricopeptide repeat protein [Archangium sp.]HEX5748848.1 tetratricopeptide repeat protein [Archangium sp.]